MTKPLKTPAIGAPLSIPVPLGIGIGGPAPPPDPWTNYGSYLGYNGGIELGTPTGGNVGPGTINASGVYVNGAPVFSTAGGTISGPLTVTGPVVLDSGISFDDSTIDCGTY